MGIFTIIFGLISFVVIGVSTVTQRHFVSEHQRPMLEQYFYQRLPNDTINWDPNYGHTDYSYMCGRNYRLRISPPHVGKSTGENIHNDDDDIECICDIDSVTIGMNHRLWLQNVNRILKDGIPELVACNCYTLSTKSSLCLHREKFFLLEVHPSPEHHQFFHMQLHNRIENTYIIEALWQIDNQEY